MPIIRLNSLFLQETVISERMNKFSEKQIKANKKLVHIRSTIKADRTNSNNDLCGFLLFIISNNLDLVCFFFRDTWQTIRHHQNSEAEIRSTSSDIIFIARLLSSSQLISSFYFSKPQTVLFSLIFFFLTCVSSPGKQFFLFLNSIFFRRANRSFFPTSPVEMC